MNTDLLKQLTQTHSITGDTIDIARLISGERDKLGINQCRKALDANQIYC